MENGQNEKVIDKIKKLLRMKRGGTAAEVETALSLAHRLANKHGIDLNSLNPDDESKWEPIGESELPGKSRLQIECKYAALILINFFNVHCFSSSSWIDGKKIKFVGTPSNMEIAKYVYGFLVNHFRHEWKTKKGRCRNRQAFMQGMFNGICSKLYRADQAEGLVLAGDKLRIKEYMDQKYDDLKSETVEPDRDSKVASYRGYLSGRNTNIRKAVTDSQPVKQLGA